METKKLPDSITIDGVNFTKGAFAEIETEAAFLEEMNTKTYEHIFEGKNREAKLKEAYARISPAKQAPSKGKS